MAVTLVGFWNGDKPPRAVATAITKLCDECFREEGVSNMPAKGVVWGVVAAVDERNGAVVGCVTVYKAPQRYEVWDLAVAEPYRRRHVAMALLAAALAAVPPTATVTIACHVNNAAARYIYTHKLGFAVLATIEYSVIMYRRPIQRTGR